MPILDRVGNAIFRQKIGIPMGSDPASFFANLFLFYYESQWIKTNKNTNFVKTKRLFNTFRFIDDLLTLNDGNEFSNIHKDIYPSELVLNKENNVNNYATFLDLNITINDNHFDYKLFDKRDAFPFKIIRFPFLSSNIPNKMFYSSISAEILRICRASSQYQPFIDACDPFLKRMLEQGANRVNVNRSLNRLLTRHLGEFSKFAFQKEQLLQKFLDLM